MVKPVVRSCARCGTDLSGVYKHECNPPKNKPAPDVIEGPASAAGFNATMPKTEGDKDKKKKPKKTEA